MKNKRSVGLFGEFYGLFGKLKVDLDKKGFMPVAIEDPDFKVLPIFTAVICAVSKIDDFSIFLNSLQETQPHLIFVSVASSNHPENTVLSFGQLNLELEGIVRQSDLPYTIVRVMNADNRPGHQHRIFWNQDLEGSEKGQQHPLPWEDLSQVVVHCINRHEALSKTFTVHATAGHPSDDWNRWFKGLSADLKAPAERITMNGNSKGNRKVDKSSPHP